jgi:hypothetical protein
MITTIPRLLKPAARTARFSLYPNTRDFYLILSKTKYVQPHLRLKTGPLKAPYTPVVSCG